MNKSTNFKFALVGGVSALGLVLGSAAFAQESGKLEEIVVTAQKRSENLQRVPISIAKISSKAIQQSGAIKTDDLAVAVPGLVIGHEINGITAFIRGIGPESNGTGEESSIAVYLDDLYVESGNAAIFDLNGVDDIEVLKGPQGTLFGRNATGGVIQVKTKDPSFTPVVDAHIGYSNYDTKSGDLYVSDAIIPGKLAANLSIYGNDETAGWGRDVITGQKAFTSENFGGRMKLLFTPVDGTKVKLAFGDVYTRSEVGMGFNQTPGSPPLGDGAYYAGFYNTTDNNNDVAVNKHQFAELRVDQETPWAKIVSISGWQRMDGYAQFNQDGSPSGLIDTRLNQVGRDVTQELQFLNPDDASYASRFTWIFGGFYMHDKSGYNHALLGGPGIIAAPFDLDLTDEVTTTSWAGFAQGTLNITKKTSMTVGARYTRDERVFGGGAKLAIGSTDVAPLTDWTGAPNTDKIYNMMTYRVSLDHQFTDDFLGYFAFNKGVKSGQFDTFGTALSGPAAAPPVNPEVLLSYELGIKSEWLDHRLRVNAAAFHYNISNLQYAVIVPGGTELINAAAAEVNGLDVDFDARPIEHLTLSGGTTIQYGHYSNFKNAPANFCPLCTPTPYVFDATGEQTVRTPKFTGRIAADYTIERKIGDFDLNVNLTHTSTFEWFPDHSLDQPATNILGASILWTAPSGNYSARIWGNNILGEEYYSFGSETIGLGHQFSPAAPATFGITLGYHFS